MSKKIQVITENYLYEFQAVRCAPSMDHINGKQVSRARKESGVREARVTSITSRNHVPGNKNHKRRKKISTQ